MKILFLAPQPFYTHRGTPIAVRLMLQALSEQGHCIRLLTFHEGEDVDIPNVHIHRIPALSFLKGVRPGFSWKKLVCDALMAVETLKWIKRDTYDIVHAVEESAFIAMFARMFSAPPYIYDMDSCLSDQILNRYRSLGWSRSFLTLLEKIVVRKSMAVVAVCKELADMAKKYAPLIPVLRLEDVSLLEEKENANKREKLQLETYHGTTVMYIGNLEIYQGIALLLEALDILIDRVQNIRAVIVGGERKHIQMYQEMAHRLGIENKVCFAGPRPVSELGTLMKQADILVSPRVQGGNTPMKIYSYLDSGRPLVATRLTTHTQVLDDEISVLVDPLPEKLAEGILRLIESPDLAAQMARKAKKRVEIFYSYGAFKEKLSTFYRCLEPRIRQSMMQRIS